jgi:hypothetical protein
LRRAERDGKLHKSDALVFHVRSRMSRARNPMICKENP